MNINYTALLATATNHHHKHHAAAAAHTTTTAIGDPNAFAGFEHTMEVAAFGIAALAAVGLLIGLISHYLSNWRAEMTAATVAAVTFPVGFVAGRVTGHHTLGLLAPAVVVGVAFAVAFHRDQADRRAGEDRRRRAEQRLGLAAFVRAAWVTRTMPTAVPKAGEIILGHTRTRIVKLLRGRESGRHVGVIGAPGSGKSTTIATLLEQHVRGVDGDHHGAVIVDPKGDATIAKAARSAAEAAGVPFIEFTPQGGVVYDMLAGGDVDRRTDKILAAEEWTEPHYLAGATTYLREVMRTLDATGTRPTLSKVLDLMDPDRHESRGGGAGPVYAKELADYLGALTPRQRGDLSGLRDRIAALARSDMAAWLDPDRNPQAPCLDLAAAIKAKAVVLFSLQADDYPMLSKKLAAAIVLDLIAVAQRHQNDPIPTFVALDEFGAIDSDMVLRLLARARGAGFSVTLAAQTLADFTAASRDGAMATRVIGNLNAMIVGRLNDSDEAEWIAKVAGTKDSWTTTQRTNLLLPANEGTRTLGRDFIVHPDQIKNLRRGEAAVIGLDPIPGQRRVEIAAIRPPRFA
jgi:hypothetical protein